MSKSNEVSRRSFIRKTAAAGAAGVAIPYFVSANVLGRNGNVGANDKIQLGLIGAGGMGRGNLRNCTKSDDVAVIGICDVWKERRDAAITEHDGKPKPYNDYRELLAQDDIDAVIIASPPHWHALQAIDACEAGKDIYLQKPMTLHLAESLAVKGAVKKHERVCQVGTQIHAGENYHQVVDHVRSGNLGKVSVARTFNVLNQGEQGVGNEPNCDPPEGLDWDLWVGPGPMRSCHPKIILTSGTHSAFLDYSGGWTPCWAPHIIDLPIWALDLGLPTMISSSGGRYVCRDAGDAYDTQETTCQYPGFTLTWMMSQVNAYGFDFQGNGGLGRKLGTYFHGVNGTLYANYGTNTIVPEGNRMQDVQEPDKATPDSPGQEREWLDCIRSREQPSCNVFYHHKVNVPIVLGNLSLKLGRSIQYDPVTEKIVGDEEAARLAVPEYRDPWKFPSEYV